MHELIDLGSVMQVLSISISPSFSVATLAARSFSVSVSAGPAQYRALEEAGIDAQVG